MLVREPRPKKIPDRLARVVEIPVAAVVGIGQRALGVRRTPRGGVLTVGRLYQEWGEQVPPPSGSPRHRMGPRSASRHAVPETIARAQKPSTDPGHLFGYPDVIRTGGQVVGGRSGSQRSS